MLSEDNENFISFFLLVLKGGTKLLKIILYKCLRKEGKTIDELLSTHMIEQNLRRSRHVNASMLSLLYPNAPEIRDVSKWDIALLSFVTLKCLDKHLIPTEKLAVEGITKYRNDLSHQSEPVIDSKKFKSCWTDLVLMITTLSHGIPEDENYLTELIRSISNDLDIRVALGEVKSLLQSSSEDVCSIRRCTEKLEKLLLETNAKLDDVNEKIQELSAKQDSISSQNERLLSQNQHLSSQYDRLSSQNDHILSQIDTLRQELKKHGKQPDDDYKLKVVAEVHADEDTTKEYAENSLLEASTARLEHKTSDASLQSIRANVDDFVDDMEKEGNTLTAVRKGSVIFEFSCSSLEAMLHLTESFFGAIIQEHLNCIRKSIEHSVGKNIDLDVYIPREQFRNILKRMDEMKHKSSIEYIVSCNGINGVEHIVNLFENGSACNSLNKLATSLSELVGKPVRLEPSLELQVMEAQGQAENMTKEKEAETKKMAHQTQLEKAKYRNWVKGALSMKYLRDGLEQFTDGVVRNEHTRILQQIGNTTGLNCTCCSLRDLKPVHTSVFDSTTKMKSCPRSQIKCNCLYPNKRSCPNKICDAIYEEILNTHASSPPSPCLKNTDITKWATHPWEVAKCFINASGYKDRQSVEEIDLAGLLHIFINNKAYQQNLSCVISGDKRDPFCKALDLRNMIFNSPNMELEEQELSECFRNIITILGDEKNLKHTQYAKEAVKHIREVQNHDFTTIETEAMVLRDITEQRFNRLEKSDIELAKGHSELKGRANELENRQLGLEQKHFQLAKGHSELEERHNELAKQQLGLEQKYLELEKGHPELERRHNELEKRQLRLEQKHTEHNQRLVRVESDVEKLMDLHKNQLTIVERRLDVRRKLADHLQKHYVKTSVSPFKTRENEIDIDKVYVKPLIQIENKESSDDEQIRESHTFVETYRSIFYAHGKRLRRIYLLGEVGSGKSAFCKMMILNWCRSVTKQTDLANCKDELENIETMKQFDFLFFLPLRSLQGNGRIREMIHWYYKDLIPVEILDDILLNVPEKCVILADGLDEWAPNPDEQRPLHVTEGLPYLEDTDKVTVLTTSRPSAGGVLNMALTESNQKLVVKGIHSVKIMAEKYMLLINDPKSDSKCVLDHLNAIKIGQLEQSPLLLQQLVWMLGNGFEVGKCISNVYSSLVNIALRWTEEKVSKNKIKSVRSCEGSSELHLPKQLVKYEACLLNRNILFTLGKVAFELLVPENNCDSQMSFGRGKLNEDGLDDDMIDTLLSIGLLTENICHDNIEHRTQFAFAHMSFQEYFAALYVASHPKLEQNQSQDASKRCPSKIILERLFRRFCSVQNIVQLGVVLQMLCGLSPEIIHDVCEYVYQTAQHDLTYSSLRDTYLLKQSNLWFSGKYVSITRDIQTLITRCILEYNCNGETSLPVSTLPILDLVLGWYERDSVRSKGDLYSELLQCIIPQKVLHLSLYNGYFISDDFFQNLHWLQTIAIESYYNFFSDILYRHLFKKLSFRKCKILSSDELHVYLPDLDLSGHHQLELLNTNCNVVNVDLKNIEILIFANRNISPILQGGIAPKIRHLEVCGVRMLKRESIEFAKFISQNVSIQVIKLKIISIGYSLDKSLINLSSHDNLQVLEFISCINISIKSVNTTNLHTVTTDRIDVLHAVRNAQKLIHLTFGGDVPYTVLYTVPYTVPYTGPYTKEMNEDVCSCSQLQEIKLIDVTIQDEALEISCGMRNLKCIALFGVTMNLPAWIRFVDSLLNLKQSVTVTVNRCYLGERIDEGFSYIKRNNKKFNLKGDRFWRSFKFETLP